MSDVADEIAWQAVATPSLDASPALDILVDVLLERDAIQPPWPPSARWRSERARTREAARSRTHLRMQAWEWACSVTYRPFQMRRYDQIKEMLDARLITMPDLYRSRHMAGHDDVVTALRLAFQHRAADT